VWPPVMCAVSASGPRRIVPPSLNRWSTRMAGYPTTPDPGKGSERQNPVGVASSGLRGREGGMKSACAVNLHNLVTE
jgi:hypothetical protein